MGPLSDAVREYTAQLGAGKIQQAYRGIIAFLSDLKTYLERKYPDYNTGAVYQGYMDMSYFAFSPAALRDRKLKIAIVYLHEEGVFELWLVGNNRETQAEVGRLLRHTGTGAYTLTEPGPGVDAIVAHTISDMADFDDPEALKKQIEREALTFADNMRTILNA